MKTILTISLAALTLAVLALGIILLLATPRAWPMTPGTIKTKKVLIEGQPFVMIDGEGMNYLGQIQSINVELDAGGNKLVVNRCMVRWNPLSKITVNNQWPVFYPLEFMKPGKYSVVYITKEGEATAGNFDVP